MNPKSKRYQIKKESIQEQLKILNKQITRRLAQKGAGTFVSKHELLGIITEEYHELIEAVHKNEMPHVMISELMDIAVACIFGATCIAEGKMDW